MMDKTITTKRRALHVSELSDEDLKELSRSKVPKKYSHLNDELDAPCSKKKQ